MSETLSFPGLGLEFQVNPVIFQITDTWAIKWYGVIVTLAFVAAFIYIIKRSHSFGLDPDRVFDVILGAVIGGIVGARLYFVAFSWDTYRGSLASIFHIWEGGIAIYGGIIGGLIVGIILCRVRRVKFLPMLDLAACGLILGQAIGRWGNFINMEAFGTNTEARWGMTSPTIVRYLQYTQSRLAELGVIVDPTAPVHPTFFYESVWCLAGFLVLLWLTGRRRFDGQLAIFYAGWYGLGRAWIEGLRTDSLMLGAMRVSQVLAVLCVLASVVLTIWIFARIKRTGDPSFLQLYVNTPEGRAVVAGTFYTQGLAVAAEAAPVSGPAALRGAKRLAAVRLRHKASPLRKQRPLRRMGSR